jgi:hypothetical protein
VGGLQDFGEHERAPLADTSLIAQRRLRRE